MTLLTTTRQVDELCQELADEPFVAIDTEFMRDRTYWPKLCLVQLAGRERHAAVDPLAPGMELAPLIALMAERRVLKVFHAARQDVEIFHQLSGAIPEPLYDTQIAAMVCGYGDEVGYETLVKQLARAQIDKSSRFTDWSRRPLSPQQLDYALADVIHLRVVYQRLCEQIEASGRREWVTEEIASLANPGIYEQPPEDAWKRLKVRSRDPRFVAIVRELAAWREREAQRRDLPRNRIVRDDLLLEIAANRPATPEQLAGLRRINLDRQSAAGVVEAVRRALALPVSSLPAIEPQARPPRGIGPLVDLLRVLLKFQCEQHHVAQRLVATTSDLEAIAAAERPEVAPLKGWRYEVFGKAALALKRGELALAVDEGYVRLVPTGRLAPSA